MANRRCAEKVCRCDDESIIEEESSGDDDGDTDVLDSAEGDDADDSPDLDANVYAQQLDIPEPEEAQRGPVGNRCHHPEWSTLHGFGEADSRILLKGKEEYTVSTNVDGRCAWCRRDLGGRQHHPGRPGIAYEDEEDAGNYDDDDDSDGLDDDTCDDDGDNTADAFKPRGSPHSPQTEVIWYCMDCPTFACNRCATARNLEALKLQGPHSFIVPVWLRMAQKAENLPAATGP